MRENDANGVLRNLNNRMQARSNGVLALFRAAGFEQERPDLKTLYTLSQVNQEVYDSIIKLLYDDGAANALGWADWASAGADALGTFFGKVSSSSSDKEVVDPQVQAKVKADAEEKVKADAEAKKTKTLIIAGVSVVVVLIVGVLVFLKRKK